MMKPELSKHEFSKSPTYFDFDAWAQLYRNDPFAFESKRQATLLIEAAKGGRSARETVAMLIAQKPSRDRQVRLEGALNQMTRSMTVLAIHLHELGRSIEKFSAESTAERSCDLSDLSTALAAQLEQVKSLSSMANCLGANSLNAVSQSNPPA